LKNVSFTFSPQESWLPDPQYFFGRIELKRLEFDKIKLILRILET